MCSPPLETRSFFWVVGVSRGDYLSCPRSSFEEAKEAPCHCSCEFHNSQTCTRIGPLLYLFGGQTPDEFDALSDKFYSLNPLSSELKEVQAKGDVPTPRIGHAACSSGGSMWLFGGVTEAGFDNTLFHFDAQRNTFTCLGVQHEVALLAVALPLFALPKINWCVSCDGGSRYLPALTWPWGCLEVPLSSLEGGLLRRALTSMMCGSVAHLPTRTL